MVYIVQYLSKVHELNPSLHEESFGVGTDNRNLPALLLARAEAAYIAGTAN